MKILLTGFEPFGGDTVNSSQETLKAVTCDEFGCVVVMLGQSGKSDCVKIERFALNLMDSVKGDNDGYIPDEETIFPDSLAVFFVLSRKPFRNADGARGQMERPLCTRKCNRSLRMQFGVHGSLVK